MSIFGRIKTAIFGEHGPLGGQFGGHKDAPKPAPAAPAQHAPATPRPAPVPQPTTPATPKAAAQPVDVEKALEAISARKGNPQLNWRTSIVDLMKLLDLDSSLDNRKGAGHGARLFRRQGRLGRDEHLAPQGGDARAGEERRNRSGRNEGLTFRRPVRVTSRRGVLRALPV